jgi:hypothetical protein
MVATVLVLCLGMLTPFVGCGKNAGSTPSAGASTPEVAELTKQVRRYAFEKRQLPKAVEDLVTAGYIKAVPPAPAGKKYAISPDRAEVILVNQ